MTEPRFTWHEAKNLSNQRKHDDLKRLAAMQDDTDDMPELTAAQLAGLQRGRFYRPVKTQRWQP